MEKASITLTDTHHQLLHAAVEAGEYASISEAIRDALRGWEFQRKARDIEIEMLREHLAEGLADYHAGRFHTWDPEATLGGILGSV